MRSIRGTDTVPERIVRALLHAAGYRFRLHRRDLPGRPDIVLPKHKTIFLVHGCFWHAHPGCKANRIPATNSDWWEAKIKRNSERDRTVVEALQALGWRVETIWECETRPAKRPELRQRLVAILENQQPPQTPGSVAQPATTESVQPPEPIEP
jgi:DNA mismatch endonuclease (patch repair protein)